MRGPDRLLKAFLLALLLCLGPGAAGSCRAQDGLQHLPLARAGVTLPVYVIRQAQATATLVLFPGGDAGTGRIVDGKPGSDNFLSRSRELFAAAGFNVVVVYRPSDRNLLEYGYRIGAAHLAELRIAVDYAKQSFGLPVWLVGTSRGTVSATAAAIALGRQIDGLVLSSSVTSARVGSVPDQNLAAITVPTLVVHHARDACRVCIPGEAARIVPALVAAPQKNFVLVDGGSNPQGDPCEARHWHGYPHYEKEVVQIITGWIRHPAS